MIETESSTKVCQTCKSELCRTNYYKDKNRKDGLSFECKDCCKKNTKLRNKLRREAPPPPHNCECCGVFDTSLVIDHCHETEKFRGWICRKCNLGIGHLGDNLSGIHNALTYLSTHV